MTAEDRTVLDLFAGPGGWDEGVRALGIRPRGVEWDDAANDTAEAAGHERIRADVASLEPLALGRVSGLIASPPCQGFSFAGKGRGRRDAQQLLDVLQHVRTRRDLEAVMAGTLRLTMADHRSLLVLEPLRYALTLTPSWLAWEQVPAVLPLWEACGRVLRGLGYTVDTAVVNAEQHGVPQTRRRAILVARAPWLTAQLGPARLPVPTHSRYHLRTPSRLDPGVAPWVSMAAALGWGMTHRPYPTLAPGTAAGGIDPQMLGGSGAREAVQREYEAGRWQLRASAGGSGTRPDTVRPVDRPAPSLAFGNNMARWGWEFAGAGATAVDSAGQVRRPADHPAHTITGKGTAAWTLEDRRSIRVTVEEAAQLQTFPPGYPWQGTKTAQYRQVGDAVPPVLAQHIVAAVAGLALPVAPDVDQAVA